jgi:hypothetical protein
VLDYVYGEAQSSADAFERDGYSLALAIIGAARRSSPIPFSEAVFSVFGCSLERHRERRAARKEFFDAEFRTVASAAAATALASHATRPSSLGVPPVPEYDSGISREEIGNVTAGGELDGARREATNHFPAPPDRKSPPHETGGAATHGKTLVI